jgi:hypothetical protein
MHMRGRSRAGLAAITPVLAASPPKRIETSAWERIHYQRLQVYIYPWYNRGLCKLQKVRGCQVRTRDNFAREFLMLTQASDAGGLSIIARAPMKRNNSTVSFATCWARLSEDSLSMLA